MSEKSNPRQAIMDMAAALKGVFKDYSRTARRRAWKSLISNKGKREIEKILTTTSRPLNPFRTLQFAEWLDIQEMAWKVGDESIATYRRWRDVARRDSKFIRVPWKEAKKRMEGMGLSDLYHDKFRQENRIPNEVPNDRFTEWAVSDFIKDHTEVVLARVDPCKLMQLRSHAVRNPDISDQFYQKKMSQDVDVDVQLPLMIVNLNGVMLYDGNHRMASACELKQDGYVAIAYFISLEPVQSAILEIIEGNPHIGK